MPRDRVPKPISPAGLEATAYHYLERFAASVEGLRRVLKRRVERAAAFHETDREAAGEWIAALIEKLIAKGILNDTSFAEMRTAGLFRRGASTRRIRETLAAKGVSRETSDTALERLRNDEGDELDLRAAVTLARRRRLGPFRPPESRSGKRVADLAALGRAGFNHEIARRVVDAEDVEGLSDDRG